MRLTPKQIVSAEVSPATAITAVSAATPQSGFEDAVAIEFEATLLGGTGGTLDVYLQTSDDGSTYVDFAHFPQLTAGQAATKYNFYVTRGATCESCVALGSGSTPAIAANTIRGGAWRKYIRAVYVAGASTSAGAAQSIKAYAYYE